MDDLSLIESELQYFTEKLYSGIGIIKDESHIWDQQTRNRNVNGISKDLIASHKRILEYIDRLPISAARNQIDDIYALQRDHDAAETQLQKAQGGIEQVFETIQRVLDEQDNVQDQSHTN